MDYVNEVIQDISGRDSNTLNIIMIDELILDDANFTEDGENLVKSDWSNLDVSKTNIFLLMAFNPSGYSSENQNSKFHIQTPGYDITNIQEDIKETIEKLSDKTENKNTLHQQLQVGYRSVKSIANLANYCQNHKIGDGKYLE